ncbi:G2/mitotic-specific cyclin-B2-like [Styela clava]
MATTVRANVLNRVDQENPAKGKSAAIIKKRTANPVTRHALGSVTNQRFGSKNIGVKQELKKPVTARQRVTALKVRDNKNVETKQIPVKDADPAPMEMGTPSKIPDVEEKNIFDRSSKPEIENIDENDAENPQLCSEFVNEIYQYMLYLEAEYPVKKHYLKDTSLKSRMRSILVDWLFQVHQRFGLLQETLYLTIAILDRFLQLQPVVRTKLQLAGVTAMLLASKYEEMYAPEVSDFVYITDKAFTRSQILQMEIFILKTLDFNLGRPLPLHFLRRNSKAGQVDANQHTLAKYLMELAMVDYEMCHVPPSRLAAAALCLSTKLLDDNDWTPTLEHYSRYSYEQLAPVVCHLAKNLKAAETSTYLNAIRNKYSSHKAFKIALIDEVKSPLVAELAEKAATIVL